MIVNLYRNYIPENFRNYIYKAFLGSIMFNLRHSKILIQGKITYIASSLLPKNDKNKALAFIGRHGITHYPGDYSLTYKNKNVDLVFDDNLALHYVIHNQKKLYFPKSFSTEKIKTLYLSLITEQDEHSAHRYVNAYDELIGKTLLDIGSAEGIFSLDTIEFVDRVYLFEFEDYWIEALNATFEPWKNKTTIIQKYVSDKKEGIYTTIDDFFKDKTKDNLFLKMDIEGAELSALQGAKATLSIGKNIHIAVCTYHKPEDPEVINTFLESLHFKTYFTNGLLFWGNRLSKALIRGSK
jgi:Methyltransferase FkbM domain